MPDLDDVRSRLEGIAEELSELAMTALREAIEEGADRRPDAEKRITRARSTIEKAIHLLEER